MLYARIHVSVYDNSKDSGALFTLQKSQSGVGLQALPCETAYILMMHAAFFTYALQAWEVH